MHVNRRFIKKAPAGCTCSSSRSSIMEEIMAATRRSVLLALLAGLTLRLLQSLQKGRVLRRAPAGRHWPTAGTMGGAGVSSLPLLCACASTSIWKTLLCLSPCSPSRPPRSRHHPPARLSRSLGRRARQVPMSASRSGTDSSSSMASSRRLSVAASRSGCSRLARSSRAPARVRVRSSSLQREQTCTLTAKEARCCPQR